MVWAVASAARVVRRNMWVQSSGGDGMPFEKPISVVIVDDHPVVRDGLSAMVSAEADIEVVAETGSGKEALSA